MWQFPGYAPPPQDRRRYPGRYAGGLTPQRMGSLFEAADIGEIGPLLELEAEIWGKDPFVGGPIGDRLTAASAVDIQIEPNPADPDQYRAVELAAYCEEVLPQLKLYRWEEGEAPGERSPHEIGGLSHVLEALSIPWYYGLGVYWKIWEAPPGMPRPRVKGLEFLDPRRYRLGADDSILLEDEANPQGKRLRSYPSLSWLAVSASRAGMRLALSGVGRALIFWWWLRIGGAADLARYLEKFGLPNVVGESSDPMGGAYTSDERAELELFLESYRNDVTALFPKGFKAIVLAAPAGGHAVFEAVERVTKSAILYGILGNEVTTSSQGAAASAGVAGGAGSVGERVQRELILGDRRRSAEALERVERDSIFVEHGAAHATYPPKVSLVDRSPGSPASSPSEGAAASSAAPPAATGAPAPARAA